MEIKVKIYSCYELTYLKVYKDVVRRIYGNIYDENITVEIEDISNNGTKNIQAQRSLTTYITRTIRIYENDELRHIVGLSNTNFDYDKQREFEEGKSKKPHSSFGVFNYHANTYFKQGLPAIFNYYFEVKKETPSIDLSFYLLDLSESYPHNLYNVLSYRELETVGFKILNIENIKFDEYNMKCNSQINPSSTTFPSLNKYLRDISYVSSRNNGNKPSFMQCSEALIFRDDGEEQFLTEKYIYTFKSLSAQAYDSLMRCWCLKVLAEKEKATIEFRLGKQYFAYSEEERKIADTLTEPIRETLKNANLRIEYVSDETFMDEQRGAEEGYLSFKAAGQLRNQPLFRNNLRKKGLPMECAICGNDNTLVLDAAHLWEINKIKKASESEINSFLANCNPSAIVNENSKYKDDLFYKKYLIANSGDNGVWLCKNHHTIFDSNYFLITIDKDTITLFPPDVSHIDESLRDFTGNLNVPKFALTQEMFAFLTKREENSNAQD